MRDTLLVFRNEGEGLPKRGIILNIDFVKEGESWVGTCLELGTFAYANSVEQAREEVAESVLLQLNGVQGLNFITDYLKDRGVKQVEIKFEHDGSPPTDRWEMAEAVA